MFGFNCGVVGAAASSVSWTTWNGTKDGTAVAFESGVTTATTIISSTLLTTDKTLVAYKYNGVVYARVITTSGNVPTTHTAFACTDGSTITDITAVCTLDSARALIVYKVSGTLTAQVLDISGTTVSGNTAYNIDTTGHAINPSLVFLSTNNCVLSYGVNTSGTGNWSVCLTMVGGVVTVNSKFKFSTQADGARLAKLTSTTVMAIYNNGGSPSGMAVVLSISSTTITTPTAEASFGVEALSDSLSVCALDATHILCTYRNSSNAGRTFAFTVSGTVVTNGAVATFESGISGNTSDHTLVPINSTTAIVTYLLSGALEGMVFTVSGTTVTNYTHVQIVAATIGSSYSNILLDLNRILSFYPDSSSPALGTMIVLSIV